MKQEPLAWYPWYWHRWQRSRRVLRLTLAARGLYRELLDECWRVGRIPDDPNAIAALTFADEQDVLRAWPTVRPFFAVRPDGDLYHPDMADLRQHQLQRHAAQVLNGRKGGRPAKPK